MASTAAGTGTTALRATRVAAVVLITTFARLSAWVTHLHLHLHLHLHPHQHPLPSVLHQALLQHAASPGVGTTPAASWRLHPLGMSKRRIPPELAAEALNIDLDGQNMTAISKATWKKILDPEYIAEMDLRVEEEMKKDLAAENSIARRRQIHEQGRKIHKAFPWIETQGYVEEEGARYDNLDDEDFEFQEIKTPPPQAGPVTHLDHVHDPKDAPWRVEAERAAKDCAEAAGLYLYDVTWSADRLEVTLSSDPNMPEGPELSKLEQATIMLRDALSNLDDDGVLACHDLIVSSPGASDVLRTEKEFSAFQGFPVIVKTCEPFKNKRVFEGRLISRTTTTLTINVRGREVKIPTALVGEVRLPAAQYEPGDSEIHKLRKKDSVKILTTPEEFEAQGEFDPPDVPQYDKTYSETAGGGLNLRSDFEIEEMIEDEAKMEELFDEAIVVGPGYSCEWLSVDEISPGSEYEILPPEPLTEAEEEHLREAFLGRSEQIREERRQKALSSYRERRERKVQAQKAQASISEEVDQEDDMSQDDS